MKKAFTLIELLAVIVIISVIAYLSFRSISSVLNNVKQKSYDEQIAGIISSANNYVLNNDLQDTINNVIAIPINTLISEGFLKKDIKNPLTGTNFSGCVWVKKNTKSITIEIINTVEETISFTYEYTDNCEHYFEVEDNSANTLSGTWFIDGSKITEEINNSLLVSLDVTSELLDYEISAEFISQNNDNKLFYGFKMPIYNIKGETYFNSFYYLNAKDSILAFDFQNSSDFTDTITFSSPTKTDSHFYDWFTSIATKQ